MTSILLKLAAAALCMTALVGPATAADSTDQRHVREVLMSTFDKPESRLQVDPVVVQGDHAIAGWTQGERGGRALLRRHGGAWQITACGGDGLKDATTLVDAGIPAAEVKTLVQTLGAAEARLPATQRAKFSTFDGLMRMNAQGTHSH